MRLCLYQFNQTHSYISDCGGLPAPSNGEIDLPDVTAVGQIVVYSCFTGYALDTAAIRTCLSSGQWSGNAPQCVSGKDQSDYQYLICVCFLLMRLMHGTLKYLSNDNPYSII